ncbi:MAG TPA: hypothetical protein VHW67_01460 [Solirubrobacteraceae bacterium]|nr:hypothetical protein [Solirubrobacteraceae bacterium]
MNHLRRIMTGVCVCSALAGLTASSASAVKPSLLLIASGSKKPVAVGAELLVELREAEVRTSTGTANCGSLILPSRVIANGGSSIQIELQHAEEQSQCSGKGAMPFSSSSYLWYWGNFPFNHGFGEIVMKPKGKSTSTGKAELLPSPSTTDNVVFAATESGLTRECDYTYKKVKGSWFSGPLAETALEKGNKLKFSGAENEPRCPKTAVVSILFELRQAGVGPVEVEVV